MANEVTVLEARDIVRESAILTSEATYNDTRIDRAIQMALGRAARITKADWDLTDVSLASGSRTDALAELANWDPIRFMEAWINDYPVERVNYHSLAREYQGGATITGRPEWLAFPKKQEMHLYPTPDAVYTLKVMHWQPLVSWTPGDPGAEDTEINLPGEWAREALWWGATSALLYGDPDALFQSTGWQRYEGLLIQNRGPDTASDPPNMDARV
jgi:hypothetical protein